MAQCEQCFPNCGRMVAKVVDQLDPIGFTPDLLPPGHTAESGQRLADRVKSKPVIPRHGCCHRSVPNIEFPNERRLEHGAEYLELGTIGMVLDGPDWMRGTAGESNRADRGKGLLRYLSASRVVCVNEDSPVAWYNIYQVPETGFNPLQTFKD